VLEAIRSGRLAGDGPFTRRCHAELERRTHAARALLTHSCTAALEMAALLAEVGPGDEVIMPSYTFVSTANAFVLRGATPVFVDIRPDTLNLNAALVADAIGPRTRAIVAVHYAGVACEMDTLLALSAEHDLVVIEDAAQAYGSRYRNRPLGTIGDIGALSFHETKNVVSGEGGALLLREDRLAARAEIIREKGTNRSAFFRGQIDKYTWADLGSSFLPGELVAAFLLAQLEAVDRVQAVRQAAWNRYHEAFADPEAAGRCRRPVIPPDCEHNAHMYYLLLPSLGERQALIAHLRERGITAPFHYVPLHSSPAGRRFGRVHEALPVTDHSSDTLVRLPLFADLGEGIDVVIDATLEFLESVPVSGSDGSMVLPAAIPIETEGGAKGGCV